MKTKYSILVLLLINSFLFGQSQIQSLVQQGMNQAYNMDFDSAEKTFNRIIEIKPNSPQGFYRMAEIYFWIYLGSKDPGEYQVFLKFADLAQTRIDKILDDNSKDYQTMYIAGNLNSFRAMAQATNNSSVDAFWSSKKAVNYFEETLELNPKYYDAYLGLGLFDYAMSFVPDFLKWAVNLTGLTSDKARGFRYIKTAFRKGSSDKTEAAFHLSKIYTDYLAEYDSASALLRNLISRYPNNTVFTYQYAVNLIKDKQFDRANGLLNRVIKLNNKKLPQVTALAYYRKGEILFKRNQFKAAIAQYEIFLDLSKDLDFIGNAALNTALSYKFLGNEAEYKKYLLLAKNGNQDIFEDSYAAQKSDRYMSNGITPVELKLVKMKNDLDAGLNKVVYDSLKTMLDKITNREDQALAYIYFGEASLELRRFAEAAYSASQVINQRLSADKWMTSTAYLIEAKIKYAKDDYANAKKLLKEAEDRNNYEFKDYLQSQIEWLKRRLPK
ncbi:MAG: tetratricopeptide repeat protein [Bacteroidota bacterium]